MVYLPMGMMEESVETSSEVPSHGQVLIKGYPKVFCLKGSKRHSVKSHRRVD